MLVVKYSDANEERIKGILRKSGSRYKIRHRTSDEEGNELIFELKIKKEEYQSRIVNAIKRMKGVQSVSMFSHEGELTE